MPSLQFWSYQILIRHYLWPFSLGIQLPVDITSPMVKMSDLSWCHNYQKWTLWLNDRSIKDTFPLFLGKQRLQNKFWIKNQLPIIGIGHSIVVFSGPVKLLIGSNVEITSGYWYIWHPLAWWPLNIQLEMVSRITSSTPKILKFCDMAMSRSDGPRGHFQIFWWPMRASRIYRNDLWDHWIYSLPRHSILVFLECVWLS